MMNISPMKLDLIITIGIVLLLTAMFLNHRRSITGTRNGVVNLGVQDLIEKVKDELVAMDLKRIRENKAAMFQVKDFDLDISFVVTESGSTKGALEFKVVTLESETNVNSEKAQRIRLHMSAVTPEIREEGASPQPLIPDENTIDVGAPSKATTPKGKD